MDVTVVVGTYGERMWWDLANERAVPSARALGVPVVSRHSPDADIADARNIPAATVTTEWLCFLDADDELEPGYFDAMAAGTADVRAPAVRYVHGASRRPARLPRVAGHVHTCDAACLDHGNWLVIGSLLRTDLFRRVGGFRPFTWSEDWDLWVRCRAAGATFEAIPAAVYRAHVRRDSRNRAPDQASKHAAHQAIARANGLPVPA